MYKRIIILSVIILAAMCGLLVLGYFSVRMWAQGMEGARLGEFASVAEQIRQDVKRKLDEFMQTEENRPYTHYQQYYVPEEQMDGRQQLALLRSPLAGKLDNSFAYGNFQIGPDGSITTPNDDITQRRDRGGFDDKLYARAGLNRKNIESNLLPVLNESVPGPVGTGTEQQSELWRQVRSIAPEQITLLARADSQKKGVKSREFRNQAGKELAIESLQNPDQKARIIKQSRSVLEYNVASNVAIAPPQEGLSRSSSQEVENQLEEALQDSNLKKDAPAKQTFDSGSDSQVSQKQQTATESDSLELEHQQVKAPDLFDVTSDDNVYTELELKMKESAAAQVNLKAQGVRSLQDVQKQKSAAISDVSEQRYRRSNAQATSSLYGSEKVGEDQITQIDKQAEQGRPRTTQVAIDTDMYEAAVVSAPAQQQELGTQDDTVKIRIEPFVPLVVPAQEGQQSIFGGQVFLLRHVQIEDNHFLQGFQLNEKKLIEELNESAQRAISTRKGMSFELLQCPQNGEALHSAAGKENVAYAAVLDFGFGDIILNLKEIDPAWISKEISLLQIWYFSIAAIVFLAVILGLASLWRNARAQLKLAQKKDDFVSAVSHELRTPLTSIRMYSEMLEKNWVKSQDKKAEYYKNMRQESERLSRLIENVLDFSRIQRGQKKYTFNLGDINEYIADVVEMMTPYAAQNGFSIKTELGLPGQTTFDGDAVTQIVVNLLDNAIKYARDAEDKTITIRTRSDDGLFLIEVEDHGPGVPLRQRKKIFEEFYRSGAEATRETNGTGLGLALVKKFAQAHNGFVEILTARPTGAIFRVALAAEA